MTNEYRQKFKSIWATMSPHDRERWRELVTLMFKDFDCDPKSCIGFKLGNTVFDIHVDIVETYE